MAYVTENQIKHLLRKNGIQTGILYGSKAKHGAVVYGFGDKHPMYPGWVQVTPNTSGDPDLPKENGVIPIGAREHLRQQRQEQYHQVLTSAGFEHKVIPNGIWPGVHMHLYRKEQ